LPAQRHLDNNPTRDLWVRHTALGARWHYYSERRELLRGRDKRTANWRDELLFYAQHHDIGSKLIETRMALEHLQRQVRVDGASLMVAVVPPVLEMQPQRAARSFEAMGIEMSVVDLSRPRRVSLGLLKELGIHACDLKADLEVVEDPFLLYDGHFTAAGHSAAAKGVATCLRDIAQ